MLALASRVSLPLTTKLILGFLLVAVPSVFIMGGVSLYAFRDLAAVNRELEEITRSLEATRDLEGAVGRALLPPSRFLIRSTPEEEQEFMSLMDEVEAQLKSCATAACHGASRQPKEMAESLVPYLVGIKDWAVAIFRPHPLAAKDKSQLLHGINYLGDQVNQQLQRMSSALLLRLDSLQKKSREVSQQARNLIVAFTLWFVALAILMAYFISRRLLKPVRELLSGTRHVREGDLGYRVAIVARDEIGELAQSFNAMTEEVQQHRERLEEMVRAKTEELKHAQESLLQSEKLASIGLLASGVAHELNNPLTGILMNVNLLMEEASDKPDIHRELKRIGDDALRCKRIIDDLRDFSRRHDLAIRSSNLNDVVSKTLGLIQHQLELHGIELRQDLCSEIPLIACDPDRMQQVLMNVFVNAIQAMSKGGCLTIKTALRQGAVEVAVRDTGPGIPKEVSSKIFDPFFTTKEGGTGLGLSIVYGLMEEHGGRVEVESLTSEEVQAASSGSVGTTIRLVLPIKAISPQPKPKS